MRLPPKPVIAWTGLWIAAAAAARLPWKDRLLLHAAPLHARWGPDAGPALIAAGAAALGARRAPVLAARIRWRRLVWLAAGAAAAWSVALALIDGPGALTATLQTRFDYLAALPLVGSPGTFVDRFPEDIGRFFGHVRTHPPGMVLLFWALRSVGLGGAGWAAAIVVAAGVAAVPAVLVGVREICDEDTARRAAPFLVFAPWTLWITTTADGLFAGVSAWAAALTILATGRRGRAADAAAVAGGIALGLAAFLSYATVLVAAVGGVAIVARRRIRVAVLVSAGVALVVAAFAAYGLWWTDALRASLAYHVSGAAGARPYVYFAVLGNPAAFAIALGPAVAVALCRLKDGRLWLPVGAALAAAVVADLTGLSLGEVERLWLPFAVWVTAATASLREGAGAWVTAQALWACAVEVAVRTP